MEIRDLVIARLFDMTCLVQASDLYRVLSSLTQNSSSCFRCEIFSIFSIMLFPMSKTLSFSCKYNMKRSNLLPKRGDDLSKLTFFSRPSSLVNPLWLIYNSSSAVKPSKPSSLVIRFDCMERIFKLQKELIFWSII